MCILHLNSQVGRYDGFTPGRRVVWRAQKLPIGAAGGPHFRDFTTPNDTPVTKTRDVLAKLREIQMDSLGSDVQEKFNLSLRSCFRELKGGSFYSKLFIYIKEWEIKSIQNGTGRGLL